MEAFYSLNLRNRVVAAVTGGMSRPAAAKHYQVGEATAIRWVKLATQKCTPAVLPMGDKKPFSLADQADWIPATLAKRRPYRARIVG